jgi:hypothetical protein
MPRLLRRRPSSLSLSEKDGEAEEQGEEDEEDDDERARPSACPPASASSKSSPLSACAPSPQSCVSSHLASWLLARDGPKSREARRPAGGGLRAVGAFASAGADRAFGLGLGFLALGLSGPGECVLGWACAGVTVSQLPPSPSKPTP